MQRRDSCIQFHHLHSVLDPLMHLVTLESQRERKVHLEENIFIQYFPTGPHSGLDHELILVSLKVAIQESIVKPRTMSSEGRHCCWCSSFTLKRGGSSCVFLGEIKRIEV